MGTKHDPPDPEQFADDAQRSRYDPEGRWIPDGSWPFHRRAPGELEEVRRFVNTRNRESGADLFLHVGAFREWLRTEGVPGAGRASAKDLAQARELRTLLHDLVQGTTLQGLHLEDQWTALTVFSRRFSVALNFDGEPLLVTTGAGISRFFSRLLITVFTGKSNGSWNRLKACSNAHCRWVYFDRSKNRSATWCADNACGGRTRARAYRARSRVATIGPT